MKFCKYCGEAIEDTVTICPKCNTNLAETTEYVTVVYNETLQSDAATQPKKEIALNKKFEKVLTVIKKYRKQTLALLTALLLLFITLAITTIISEDYQECSENYSKYIDNYKEKSAISNSYGEYGILGNGYKIAAEGWKDLADDELAELWRMRVKAIIFVVIGIGCGLSAYKVYKFKEES